MLNEGTLIECPITSDYIVTADEIYGHFVPELRGNLYGKMDSTLLALNQRTKSPNAV